MPRCHRFGLDLLRSAKDFDARLAQSDTAGRISRRRCRFCASPGLGRRREDLKWKREVLLETLVSFFDASFAFGSTPAFMARRAGESPESLERYRGVVLDAHLVKMTALTRLQFLAKPKVLQCAFELHKIEGELYDALFREHGQLDESEWQQLLVRRRDARTNLFNAARRNMGLRPTVDVSPPVPVGPRRQELIDHEMKRQQSSASSVERRAEKSSQRRPRAKQSG